MTLEMLVEQFKRNARAYFEQGNASTSQAWFTAADLLEEYLKEVNK